MIILVSWPVLAVLAGAWALLAVIGSIIYGIQNSWDEEKVAWLKTFSVKQKWGLFALLLGILGSVGAFIAAIIYHNSLMGVLGFVGWLITSFVAAYICSPMRLVFTGEGAPNIGCGPLAAVAMLASAVLIMAFSWVFVLIAIFRKATWRLFVGILAAVLLFFVGVYFALTISENIELKNRYAKAESLVAAGDYDAAAEMYLNLNEQELYLQTCYARALWNLEQGNYHDAKTEFLSLAEEHSYRDCAEMWQKTCYQQALQYEAEANYSAAAGAFDDVLDYLDAGERYQRCCYLVGLRLTDYHYSTWDDVVSWFEKAGDYEDAPQLVIYYQALMLGHEELAAAEELLLQLPRDYRDVDTMLTAIETYRDWGGSYVLKSANGKAADKFESAKLVLVYTQWSVYGPELEWKVVLAKGNRDDEIHNDGEMPEKGTLKFTYEMEGWYVYDFQVTKQKLKLTYDEIKYGSHTVTTFEFVKE